MSNLNKLIGIRLKQLREKHNLTGIQLAEAIGVSKSQISLYEKGDTNFTVEQLSKIAQFFSVSEVWLAYGVENSTSSLPLFKEQNSVDKVISNLLIELERYRKREDVHLQLLGKPQANRLLGHSAKYRIAG